MIMNDRIETLAKAAGYDMINKAAMRALGFDVEKFAELIVKECLNEIQSLLDCNTQVDEFEQGVYNGLDMAKDCIKQHFGVEE